MSIPTPDRERTIALMKQYGIKKATIHFSGGNDEGYAEPAALEMEEGRATPALPTDTWSYRDTTYSPGRNYSDPYPINDDAPELVQLVIGLEHPIDSQYGSFAGDFYVDGDVIWDAKAGTCVMEHDYETPSSEHLSTAF